MSLPALCILYGSATGNAEHIAKELSTSIPSSGEFYSSVICCEMNQFKRKCQKAWENEIMVNDCSYKHPVICVTSTTGNGDAPENASRFVRYVKKGDTAKTMPFRNCVYAVMALGDTNYDQFCATGKLVDRKMKDLGGTRAKKIALADEGTGLMEEVVEPWLETVLADLCKAATLSNSNSNGDVVANANAVEEKKEEKESIVNSKITNDDTNKVNLSTKSNEDTNTPGLSLIDEIAKKHNIIIPDSPPPNSSIPSLTASMSSCTLIQDQSNNTTDNDTKCTAEDEQRSIISGSSLSHGCHYNIQNPFSSTILAARYLTNTSTTPASKVSALLSKSTNTTNKMETNKSIVNELTSNFDIQANPKHGKRVIELTLSLPEDDSLLEYEPGDSIGLLVTNEYTSSFHTVLARLEQTLRQTTPTTNLTTSTSVYEQLVSINNETPITIYDAIAKFIDITSIVKKRILARLAQLCTHPNESKILSLLASKTPQGEQLYTHFVEYYQLHIGHILDLFPSCQPTIKDLLAICDGMSPRYYSISSSQLVCKNRLTIAFSVVDYLAFDDNKSNNNIVSNRRGGLATQFLEIQSSSFLSNNNNGNNIKISIFPKPTTDFRLPKSLSTPLILIGPGTGVAPFIGFLSHRASLLKEKKRLESQAEEGTWRGGFEIQEDEKETVKNENKINSVKNDDAKSILFFGCRWADHDYLFKNELEAFVNDGTLTSLYTAFSRTNNNLNARKYVQHEMQVVGKELIDLICNQNASVYVCGDGNAMGKDVQDCLASLLDTYKYGQNSSMDNNDPQPSSALAGSKTSGKIYVEEMKKKHKFVLDIWS